MAKVCPSCELTYSDNEFFCAVDGAPLRSTGTDGDNLVGTVIADRYRIDAILGEGGMGRVYRARHVRVPREAAIKVLRRALIADPYAVAAFNREARNAASVGDHPNVAAVYDFGETSDGLVFLAMEYIEGETLSRRLEREPILSPRRTVEIVRQIAAGLTAAHELPEPVVHRDLKPDNILLKTTKDGSDWVKIVDFGIAKALKRDTQLLTTPGLVVGTPRCMSPEQLTGGTIDVRTDVYALAIMAYRMLTGTMPFPISNPDDESTIQWALQRLTQAPLSLQEAQSNVQWPAGVQAVFDRALQRDPEQRTPTAAEFARALGRGFGFMTPSGVMGAVPDVTQVRQVDASAGVSPVAATAPIPAQTHGAKTRLLAPAPTGGAAGVPVASGAAGRTRRTLAIAGIAAALVVGAGAVFLWSRSSGRTAASPAAEGVVPNDSLPGIPDSGRALAATTSKTPGRRAPGPTDSKAGPRPVTSTAAPPVARDSSVRTNPPSESGRGSEASAAQSRATLDEVKAAVADPYAAAAAGKAPAILERIDRLLPTLTSRIDSVEATSYAVEVNLALDRPAVACRLLDRIRSSSRGTPFQGSVEFYLADTTLACASRR